MNDRAEFEKRFRKPDGVFWDNEFVEYAANEMEYELDADEYNKMWQVWQAARAQSGQEVEPVDGQWLIQMRGDYLTTRGVWERPDHRGYTNDIHEAGRYSEADAKEAERMMPDKCKAVRLPVIYRQPAQQGSVPEGDTLKQAARYRWLRDNKHLDAWWSVEGPTDRCDNIDRDIDEAMAQSPQPPQEDE